ncbi:response regulator [Krasilnikovia sp. MM14-A1004]|uniref:response regulator n=1 Tax=Krasilnikovia sp. MM14-A1004 TaxID=3373541 RepID=UPI00399D4332
MNVIAAARPAQARGYTRLFSATGHGTVFSMLLPAAIEAAQQRPRTEPARVRGYHGDETILVVDDEDGIREVARRVLTSHGYRVLTAADGPQAIQIAARHPDQIHLLLTDVMMPTMPGTEVAEQITALRPGLPVLYMSGYAGPVLAAAGTLDRTIALLEKPFTIPTLLSKVRDVLIHQPADAASGHGPG